MKLTPNIHRSSKPISPIPKFPKFSDFKNNTLSTAQKNHTDSDLGENVISQFVMSPSPQPTIQPQPTQSPITFASLKLRHKLTSQIQQNLINYKKMKGVVEGMKKRRKDKISTELIKQAKGDDKKLMTFEKVSIWKEIMRRDPYMELIENCSMEVDGIEEEISRTQCILKSNLEIENEAMMEMFERVTSLNELITQKIKLAVKGQSLFEW